MNGCFRSRIHSERFRLNVYSDDLSPKQILEHENPVQCIIYERRSMLDSYFLWKGCFYPITLGTQSFPLFPQSFGKLLLFVWNFVVFPGYFNKVCVFSVTFCRNLHLFFNSLTKFAFFPGILLTKLAFFP